MKPQVEDIKKKILPILKKYGVKKAGVFGSIVRGEANEDSDIDVLVEIESKISLLDFVGLKLELEEALQRKVDLGEYSVIKPVIKDQQQMNIRLYHIFILEAAGLVPAEVYISPCSKKL